MSVCPPSKSRCRALRWSSALVAALALGACALPPDPPEQAQFLADSNYYNDLAGPFVPLSQLPHRAHPIPVAVYPIPDKTGAQKANPDFAEISKAVTQGAEALVLDALTRTGGGTWFTVLERSEFNALANERKIETAQAVEARQRSHTTRERQRIARERDRVETEIAALRDRVASEYAAMQAAGGPPPGTPSIDQTLENLANLRRKRLSEIDPEQPFSVNEGAAPMPELLTADYILTGAVVAYDSDFFTGGLGLRFWNTTLRSEVRKDTITVNLRLVDTRTGALLSNQTTTQTVVSRRRQGDFMNYVSLNKVLEFETGYAFNEPKTFALDAAFQLALGAIVSDMRAKGLW